MSSPAFAVKTTGLRVVVVKTDDVAAYLKWLEKGKAVSYTHLDVYKRQ